MLDDHSGEGCPGPSREVEVEPAAESARLRERGLDAQGAIQPVIGFMRLAQSKGEPIDEDALRRLEEAHDAIKRIVDGEDYIERWAALDRAGGPAEGEDR
jgi:hypothetical protein